MARKKTSEHNNDEFNIIKRMINYRDGWKSTPMRKKFKSCLDVLKSYKKVIFPNLIIEDGWVIKEILEHPKPIYPENKRWDYLSKKLCEEKQYIDIAAFEYQMKGTKTHYKTVYRLKKDKKTFETLFRLFHKEGLIYDFIKSEYFHDARLPDYFKIKFFVPDIDKIKKKNYEKYIDLLEEAIDKIDENQKLMLIPPSLILAYLDGSNIESMTTEIGFKQLLKSFIIYDYTTCNDKEYKEIFKQTLKKIEEWK